MDRVIKFRYTCVKPLSTFHEFFTIEKIERGDAKTWMDMNVVLIGQLHRDRFTGLLDKNGTEIYEGDRLKHTFISLNKNGGKSSDGFITVDSIFDFELMHAIETADELEVIGNIHEAR